MQHSLKPTTKVSVELSFLKVKGKTVWSYWITVNDVIIHHDYIDSKYTLKDIIKRHNHWTRDKYQTLKTEYSF